MVPPVDHKALGLPTRCLAWLMVPPVDHKGLPARSRTWLIVLPVFNKALRLPARSRIWSTVVLLVLHKTWEYLQDDFNSRRSSRSGRFQLPKPNTTRYKSSFPPSAMAVVNENIDRIWPCAWAWLCLCVWGGGVMGGYECVVVDSSVFASYSLTVFVFHRATL